MAIKRKREPGPVPAVEYLEPRVLLSVVPYGVENAWTVGGMENAASTDAAPSAVVTTPTLTGRGDVSISSRLMDAQSRAISLQAQYSADGGATWHPATPAAGTAATGLKSSPLGVAQTFVWASAADLPGTDNADVEFRITPTDSGGTGSPASTGPFTVDNSASGVWLHVYAGHSGTITDADGDSVTVSLAGTVGRADLLVPALNVNADIGQIILNGTDATNSLSIRVVKKAGGDGRTTVQDLLDPDGSMGSIQAPQVDLGGDVLIGGTLATLALGDLTSGLDSIQVRTSLSGDPRAQLRASFGGVADASMDTNGEPIRSVVATSWASGDIRAGALTSLTIKGDFGADLALGGAVASASAAALGGASIGGAVSGSTWSIGGKAGAITIGGAVSDWMMQGLDEADPLTGVASLTAGLVTDGSVTLTGALGTLKAVSWNGGVIQAASVGALNVTGKAAILATKTAAGTQAIPGDFTASITLSGAAKPQLPALGSANIAGAVSGSIWDIIGSSGAITIGAGASTWKARFAGALAGLTAKGDFDAKLCAASLGPVSVSGDMQDAMLLAGADLGDDAQPGGSGSNADVFNGGNLASFKAAGSVSVSVVAAGLNPANGVWGDGDDFFPAPAASAVGSFSVRGTVDDASYFAGTFPKSVSIGGQSVNPSQSDLFLAGTGPLTPSAKTASPGALLTITGHFSTTADTQVIFEDSSGNKVTMAPANLSATSLQVVVPLCADFDTAQAGAGFVSVLTCQSRKGGLVSSAPVAHFGINDLPQTGLAVSGSLTNAYLDGMQQVLQGAIDKFNKISQASNGKVDVSALVSQLQGLKDQYASVQQLIAPILSDQTASVDVGTCNGQGISLDASALEMSDRVLSAAILGNKGAAPTTAMSFAAMAGGIHPSSSLGSVLLTTMSNYFRTYLANLMNNNANAVLATATKMQGATNATIAALATGAALLAFTAAAPLAPEALLAAGLTGAAAYLLTTVLPAGAAMAMESAAWLASTGNANWAASVKPSLDFMANNSWDYLKGEFFGRIGGLAGAAGTAAMAVYQQLDGLFAQADPTDVASTASKIERYLSTINANLKPLRWSVSADFQSAQAYVPPSYTGLMMMPMEGGTSTLHGGTMWTSTVTLSVTTFSVSVSLSMGGAGWSVTGSSTGTGVITDDGTTTTCTVVVTGSATATVTIQNPDGTTTTDSESASLTETFTFSAKDPIIPAESSLALGSPLITPLA